jgi:pyruvate formate lyase activating enzyme
MATSMDVRGRVFDTQRFCLHDGRGIRTTVFLKGCPLRCQWCHNPESLSAGPERSYRPGRCIGCRMCIAACSHGALRWHGEAPEVDPAVCVLGGACAAACPSGATELLGAVVGVEDVLRELRRDVAVFDESGGGVTLSGGEPLAQPDFLEALLAACRSEGLHTTVDTSGYAPADVVRRIAALADAFLFDVKHPDDDAHRRVTGVSNRPIVDNLHYLNALQQRYGAPSITVRIPLVAGINDSAATARGFAALLSRLDPRPPVELLPYQRLGEPKYIRLGRAYPLPEARPPSAARLETIVSVLRATGLAVTIRGDEDASH